MRTGGFCLRKRAMYAKRRAAITKVQALAVAVVVVGAFVGVGYAILQVPVPKTTTSSSTVVVGPTQSSQTGSTSTTNATAIVGIQVGSASNVAYSYLPDAITVVMGVNNTVTWVNYDNAAHTVTANDGTFSSGNISPGGVFTFTFTGPGIHRYYCVYHSWMIGVVTVKAAP